MNLLCERPVNPKFSPVKANSKNKTGDFVYCRPVLLSRLAHLLQYIISNSSNVSLIRGKYMNPATFQTKSPVTKDIGFQ